MFTDQPRIPSDTPDDVVDTIFDPETGLPVGYIVLRMDRLRPPRRKLVSGRRWRLNRCDGCGQWFLIDPKLVATWTTCGSCRWRRSGGPLWTPPASACESCDAEMVQPSTGRRRKYCSDRCRVAASRARRAAA